jgi:glycosyltransferase involved in cell wall biosynthesis
MRILLTADPGIPVPPVLYGGIERIVADLCAALRARGIFVGLLAQAGSVAPADATFVWPESGGLRRALALRNAAAEMRADLVHGFSRLAYLAGLLASRCPMLMSYQRHPTARNISWAARLGGDRLWFSGCSDFITGLGSRAGGRWFSVPNFVDLSRFDFSAAVPQDAPLLFLSRVERVKGAHRAIRIARAAGRDLVIAGNRAFHGQEARYFEEQIAPQVDGRSVRYVGAVDDARKALLLRQACALLVPIEWDEPFGIVFAEALASGTPVIASPRGALPQIVDHGVHGFLASDEAEAAEFVRAISTISRAECRLRAEQEFSAGIVAARYVECYEQMLSARRGASR